MKIRNFLFLLFIFEISCVTPKGTFYRNFVLKDNSLISVGDFKSYFNYTTSGEMIQNLFIQELLRRGFEVKDSISEDVEYVLAGSVTRFEPEKKYIVYIGNDNNKQVVLDKSLVEISGNYVYKIGTVFGLKDAEVISTNSTVGVSAKLIEKKTGRILWSSSFTYESLTVETAASVVVNYLVTSLTSKK